MNRLNRSQKQQVQQVQAIVGASDKIAIECLRAAGWSVEGAINIFFSSNLAAQARQQQQQAPRVDAAAVDALFNRYQDKHQTDLIMAEGVQRLCEELGVDPADIVMLVLSWHLKAETMCEFTRAEWSAGLARLQCDSLAKLKAKLPALRRELTDDATFREVYEYAYSFSREKGQKCVQLETALGMWQLLLRERWPLLDAWCGFLEERHKHAISRDTWSQLWDFITTVKSDMSDYDENGAWPYLLDEFVEHTREEAQQQQQQGGQE